MKIWVVITALVISSGSSGLLAQPYGAPPYQEQPNSQRRLGILGGLGGAAIGAAIGEDDGDAVPGALIGGTIGLITGAAAGNAIDEKHYRNQRYQAALAQQQAQAVTMGDVVSMTQAGLSDAVIINHIQTHGVAHHIAASDLIVLKQQGVSDPVLSAMQGVRQPVTVIRQPAPVIVEEHYYSRPSPVWWHHGPYHHHHRHYHRGYRGRSGVHFSFGH